MFDVQKPNLPAWIEYFSPLAHQVHQTDKVGHTCFYIP